MRFCLNYKITDEMSINELNDSATPQSQEEFSSTKPRESLITTAVHFLQNPKVRRSPLQQKQKFLRSKGLTEDEIQIACEKAGSFNIDPNNTIISMDISHTPATQNYNQLNLVQKPSLLIRIKDILQSIAIFGSFAYACYLFYKKYIEPFLFGKKRRKSIEEHLQEMDDKFDNQIKQINNEIIRVREEIVKNNENNTVQREISNFKSDLDAIKGLLLNKKQFANPLPILPPSIPAWQLSSQPHHHHHHSHGNASENENEPDKNDDAGSGSGSSETEVVTKNSDSSLEIM